MTQYARIVHDIKIDDGMEVISIAMAIEASLGIEISDDAWSEVQTLGQMHDLICRETKQIQFTGSKCATAMSFYRLKAAIDHTAAPRRLSPSTSLKSLSDFDYPAVTRQLEHWVLPSRSISVFGLLLSLIIILAINIPLGFLIGKWSVLTGMLCFVPCLAFTARFLPSRLPEQKTVGELASNLAARNLHRLAEEGAALTPRTIWKALVHIVAEEMGIDPKQLSRESRFI